MTDVLERYRRIADGFDARVDGVAPEQWASPSPCDQWTARDVLAHVVEVHRRILAGAEARDPDPLPPDADLVSEWRTVRATVEESLLDPARASMTGRFAPLPFDAIVARLLCADTLVHTWDLARATGQEERLDEAAVADTYRALAPMDAILRGSGAFGPRVDPPPGADEQTELLCFLGRRA